MLSVAYKGNLRIAEVRFRKCHLSLPMPMSLPLRMEVEVACKETVNKESASKERRRFILSQLLSNVWSLSVYKLSLPMSPSAVSVAIPIAIHKEAVGKEGADREGPPVSAS